MREDLCKGGRGSGCSPGGFLETDPGQECRQEGRSQVAAGVCASGRCEKVRNHQVRLVLTDSLVSRQAHGGGCGSHRAPNPCESVRWHPRRLVQLMASGRLGEDCWGVASSHKYEA